MSGGLSNLCSRSSRNLARLFRTCQAFVVRYHAQTMYNIKQAAARAGISVPVLRAWERRYGIVSPPRTAAGYRRFDDATVARVRTMRQLVHEGWSPSAAAAAILSGEVAVRGDTEEPVGAATRAEPAGQAAASGSEGSGEVAERLVRGARDLDASAIELVLDDLFSRGSFERVATDLLFPSLRRLGDAWASGAVSVAGEHLASGAVQRRLGLALDGAGLPVGDGPRIVVGLPPGARHELGALAFAVAARRAGLSVAYLGADLPVADWVAAAASADAAVVGVVTRRDRRAALKVAKELRATHANLVVAFGGDAAPDAPGVLRLPAPLADSVAALSEALASQAGSATRISPATGRLAP
jgi:MerR family transcriptional regulator, light-induced transcriptional regulator